MTSREEARTPVPAFIMLFVLVGCLVGLLVANVSPSAFAVQAGVFLGVVFGGLFVIRTESRLRDRTLEPSTRGYWLLRRRWLRIPLAFSYGLVVSYATFAWSVPWAVNECFGSVHRKSFVVTGWHGRSRYTCARFEVGHQFFVDPPHAFCIPSDARPRQYVGSAIQVEGPATILGINTKRILVSASVSGWPRVP